MLTQVSSGSSTIFAKSGYVNEDEKSLILFNGNIQRTEPDKSVSIVKFEKTSFSLSGISTKSISEPKLQEISTINIIKCMQGKKLAYCTPTKKTEIETRQEINKRLGTPFFIPLIALICCFLLTSRKDKKIHQFNKPIYFSISFLILTAAEIAVRYSGSSWNYTVIYYLIPVGMMPLFYFALIRKFKYENLH